MRNGVWNFLFFGVSSSPIRKAGIFLFEPHTQHCSKKIQKSPLRNFSEYTTKTINFPFFNTFPEISSIQKVAKCVLDISFWTKCIVVMGPRKKDTPVRRYWDKQKREYRKREGQGKE